MTILASFRFYTLPVSEVDNILEIFLHQHNFQDFRCRYLSRVGIIQFDCQFKIWQFWSDWLWGNYRVWGCLTLEFNPIKTPRHQPPWKIPPPLPLLTSDHPCCSPSHLLCLLWQWVVATDHAQYWHRCWYRDYPWSYSDHVSVVLVLSTREHLNINNPTMSEHCLWHAVIEIFLSPKWAQIFLPWLWWQLFLCQQQQRA